MCVCVCGVCVCVCVCARAPDGGGAERGYPADYLDKQKITSPENLTEQFDTG